MSVDMASRWFERQEREAEARSSRTGEGHEEALQAMREGKAEVPKEDTK